MFGKKKSTEKLKEPEQDKSPEIDARLLKILKEADFIKSHVAAQMGIELEYNYCCMLQIDLLIDKLLGGNASEDPQMTSQIFGSYFGECVRRTFGGRWLFREDGEAVIENIGGVDITVMPYSTLRTRIFDEEEQKVFAASRFIAKEISSKFSKLVYGNAS